MNTLPEMTIEKRESELSHGITDPNVSEEFLNAQLDEATILNMGALRQDLMDMGWREDVLKILAKYVSSEGHVDIVDAVSKVTGFESWAEVTEFVQDDECLEFFNMALRFCKREGQKHKRELDFIDGSGIGYVKAYTKRLKTTLEHCFDAKYKFKVLRPLEYAKNKGVDMTKVANHIHPGHWSYPAGHGTKFLTAVEMLNDVFHLDSNCYDELLLAAEVLSMGRSGSLIHYPIDNLAGGKLTTLKRYQ